MIIFGIIVIAAILAMAGWWVYSCYAVGREIDEDREDE